MTHAIPLQIERKIYLLEVSDPDNSQAPVEVGAEIPDNMMDYMIRGSYEFKYNVMDRSGNEADEVVFLMILQGKHAALSSCASKSLSL